MTKSVPSASQTPKLPHAPRFVATDAALRELAADLKGAEWLAFDTEFIGERQYLPRLEILQIAAPGLIAIVDHRGVRDLTPLAVAFDDRATMKIVHAGSQDLEIMKRVAGVVPRPLFDTQLAAAFLGYGLQASLSTLAEALAGLELDGRHTTSDWSVRPLSDAQIEYAANDVAWLGEMRDKLDAALKRKGRLAWFEEEQSARVEEVAEAKDTPDEDAYLRVKGSMALRGRELAFLRELAAWRERTARRLDASRRLVMTDDGLVDLAQHPPTSRDAMTKMRRLPMGPAMKHSSEILEVLAAAGRIPKDAWPKRPAGERLEAPPPGVVELVQAVLRNLADSQDIAPALLATTGELNVLASLPQERRAAHDTELLRGWRRQVAGLRILELLDGRLAVRIGSKGLEIA